MNLRESLTRFLRSINFEEAELLQIVDELETETGTKLADLLSHTENERLQALRAAIENQDSAAIVEETENLAQDETFGNFVYQALRETLMDWAAFMHIELDSSEQDLLAELVF